MSIKELGAEDFFTKEFRKKVFEKARKVRCFNRDGVLKVFWFLMKTREVVFVSYTEDRGGEDGDTSGYIIITKEEEEFEAFYPYMEISAAPYEDYMWGLRLDKLWLSVVADRFIIDMVGRSGKE